VSYTPCDLCGAPLLGHHGSACTNPACANRARPDDPNPHAKTVDGTPYRFSAPRPRRDIERQRALRRAFKGIA
jgi:hypothetical protein